MNPKLKEKLEKLRRLYEVYNAEADDMTPEEYRWTVEEIEDKILNLAEDIAYTYDEK